MALSVSADDIATYSGPLWRIHTTGGTHPSAWDELREYGPIEDFRWEPQPEPPGSHPGVGVSYTAPDPVTCFAEVFQADRAIHLVSQRTLSGWELTRPLALLDLTGDWALRHGASASLPHTTRNTCRGWARAIVAQLGNHLDGLWTPSTLTGRPMVVLYQRAASAFPTAPAFTRPLLHPDVLLLADRASLRLGWPLI
jgi:hypothetical protein